MELLTLALFCVILLICVCLNLSILWALTAGLVLFCAYARLKGSSMRDVLTMCLHGIQTAKNVLTTFFLIGILTAMWRAAGTIPSIVCYASGLFVPSLFLTVTFLLNSLVSFLTGTAFGTAATMGVICATLAAAMGIPPALTGGAVLSGVFFGDRCSPLSTSALLVSELTHTDIFSNIRRMVRSALVPFLASCVLYTAISLFCLPQNASQPDLNALFQKGFLISGIALIPAIVVLALSLFRVPVKIAMLVSIVLCIPISICLQGETFASLFRYAVLGYTARNAELAGMVSGGGIISMLKVSFIVCISSAYSGIFQTTHMLVPVQHKIENLSDHIAPFGATLITACLAGMIACNQTLCIILTHQLCGRIPRESSVLALDIADSAVLVAALVPWSIASGVPLSTVSAPTASILFAFYLFLVPLWRLITMRRSRK